MEIQKGEEGSKSKVFKQSNEWSLIGISSSKGGGANENVCHGGMDTIWNHSLSHLLSAAELQELQTWLYTFGQQNCWQ